jgi:hypothetical protein
MYKDSVFKGLCLLRGLNAAVRIDGSGFIHATDGDLMGFCIYGYRFPSMALSCRNPPHKWRRFYRVSHNRRRISPGSSLLQAATLKTTAFLHGIKYAEMDFDRSISSVVSLSVNNGIFTGYLTT